MNAKSNSRIAVTVAAAGLTFGGFAPLATAAHGEVRSDPAVITTWNGIAARTMADAAVPVPVSALYFAFVNIATYDAVVTVEGRYRPYNRLPRPHAKASSEAAAATAAYQTLVHYIPAAKAQLDLDYVASLAKIPDGIGKVEGQRVGATAAQVIITKRTNDGRGANITLDVPLEPGVWRPTPDGLAPMAVPWLGFVTPLALRSPTQIELEGPDSLRSKAYARDFAEVKAYGEKEGSARSAWQTETALFWTPSSILQFQAGLSDHVTRHRFGIVRSARAFAALSTATADALIACWRAKYDFAYWRPITAIREADTDGNRRTDPEPTWTPLIQTPPYPDYTSGHACIVGATTEVLGRLLGKRSLDLNVSSTGPNPPTSITRHFESTKVLDAETINARIWLGIHFRRAMTDGNQLGHHVAGWTMQHYFRPLDH